MDKILKLVFILSKLVVLFVSIIIFLNKIQIEIIPHEKTISYNYCIE
jgi:hypothetical protein